jgi:hypothetical protein
MVNEERLIQLMENFKGQNFQWIKTNRPELLGKTVKCRSIEPRGNKFIVLFDDGSSVDSDQLNSALFMITEDMQPLSKAEVEAIAGPSRVQPKPRVQPVNSQITDSVTQSMPGHSMFEMFDSNDRDIQLGITVKLPDQDFLGMLYSNAKDKDKFMDELTDFVFRVINKKVVKESITKMFDVPQPAKKSGEINFTEIHE